MVIFSYVIGSDLDRHPGRRHRQRVDCRGPELWALARYTQHMLSLAAGALLATAFLHLLPEAFESQAGAHDLFLTLLVGLVFFFLLDKAELWHHGHEHHHEVAAAAPHHHAHEHPQSHAHAHGHAPAHDPALPMPMPMPMPTSRAAGPYSPVTACIVSATAS
jgi:hypothetical protein